jgi:hypothetical protein
VLSDTEVDDYIISKIGLHDRFFMMCFLLRRQDVLHPWLYDRFREVESDQDGYLDLWARFHYKSSAITFAGSIQEIARNSDITIGIFSHTRPIAKGFLTQIKQECEQNYLLPRLYPCSFWVNPRKNAPTWSLDSGLVMPRKANPKEATVEAWGLVDGQPISRHYSLMIYDDVVTRDSVTAAMAPKTTEAWELSRSLCTHDHQRSWMVGTRYSYSDTYGVLIARGAVKTRIYPATDTGTIDGSPVFMSDEMWETLKRETSAKTIACQQLQNPIAGEEQELKPEWMRLYEVRPETLNVAILADPANSKKGYACNTAMVVIGLDAQRNKYFLDGVCHRLALHERWEMLKSLRQKWIAAHGVQIVRIGYERYGMQSDIQYFEQMMSIENYHFPIEEVNWVRDGENAKDDRIRRLIPDHQMWRFFYPYNTSKNGETSLQASTIARGNGYLCSKAIKRKNHEGKLYDLVEWFQNNEYLFFPASNLKDMLDAMSRFYDLENFNPPQIVKQEDCMPEPEYEEEYY